MAYSVQQFTSTGTEDHVILSFPYLDKSDVHLYSDSVEVNFTWASDTRINFNPFPAGAEIVVRRLTNKDRVVYLLQEGAPFTREVLDLIHTQILYLTQEAAEGVFFDMYGDINMHGFRIRNAGAPVLPKDYTTKEWTEAAIQSVNADYGLRSELASAGGSGLILDAPKPVTWHGFAGGADPTGNTSSKLAIKAALEYGGHIHFPDGIYFIEGEGADAGGVLATITKSLQVTCAPNARFVTDSLDNDFIRIEIPSNGAGLPAEKLVCDWDGGFFDQRNQRNSTVVPFMPEYPPAKPGFSATADAVSIRGFYTDSSGKVRAGLKRATIRRVVTYAGDHWQSAGGDSGVFIAGAEEQVIEYCYLKGNRDLGVYASAHESGQLNCAATVRNNVFDTCFHGAAGKRGFASLDIVHNTFINCVRAAQSEFISVRNRKVNIQSNNFIGCGINVRIQRTDGGCVSGNHDEFHGATLADGSIEPVVGLRGYLVDNSSDIHVGPNTATAENPLAAIVYPLQGQGITLTGTTTGCVQRGNTFRGWRRLGSDETTGGKNRWFDNLCPDGTAKNVVFTDITNGVECRVADALGNAPWWRTPQYFFPTDESAPILRGYSGSGAPTGGIYFKGPDVGLAGPNVLIQGNLYPVTPNTTAIGAATSPVAGGWTQSAFTVTSDERAKTRPFKVTDAVLDAVAEIDWVQFQLIDRILDKGEDGARWHVGVMAQAVQAIFERHGLDARDFAFFCYDEWEEKAAVTVTHPAVYDIHGMEVRPEYTEVVQEAQAAGNAYSIRYEELLILKQMQMERDLKRAIASNQ